MINKYILFRVFNFNYIILLIHPSTIFFLIHLGYLKFKNLLYHIIIICIILIWHFKFLFFFFLLRKEDSNAKTQNHDNLFKHLTQPKGYIIQTYIT